MKTDEWLSILELAKMWYFMDIHALAVDDITTHPMDPVERIVLAREHYVIGWLETGYLELAQRTLAPSVEEVERIGYTSGTLVFHVREKRIADPSGFIESWVRTVFAEELEDLEKQNQNFMNSESELVVG